MISQQNYLCTLNMSTYIFWTTAAWRVTTLPKSRSAPGISHHHFSPFDVFNNSFHCSLYATPCLLTGKFFWLLHCFLIAFCFTAKKKVCTRSSTTIPQWSNDNATKRQTSDKRFPFQTILMINFKQKKLTVFISIMAVALALLSYKMLPSVCAHCCAL